MLPENAFEHANIEGLVNALSGLLPAVQRTLEVAATTAVSFLQALVELIASLQIR